MTLKSEIKTAMNDDDDRKLFVSFLAIDTFHKIYCKLFSVLMVRSLLKIKSGLNELTAPLVDE